MPKGVKIGGRKKGSVNKVTASFREAVAKLLDASAPKLQQWLDEVAHDDPKAALDHVAKLAEYCFPKLARSDNFTTATVKSMNVNLNAELEGDERAAVIEEWHKFAQKLPPIPTQESHA